ncbi:chromatin modification-related protein EAF1 B-like [Tasmannia lanceolata]|uniref:chromatin modification-related protein EAF1 B-like n=1 Tax=Tasmannia lanceolata TaxID=3420 RepID=UPI004062B585
MKTTSPLEEDAEKLISQRKSKISSPFSSRKQADETLFDKKEKERVKERTNLVGVNRRIAVRMGRVDRRIALPLCRRGEVEVEVVGLLGFLDMPSPNSEDQKQMIMQELPQHLTRGNGHGTPPFSGPSTAFVSPLVQTFPIQHQNQHQMPPHSHVLNNHHYRHLQGTTHNPQTQAHVLHLAKGRHQNQQWLFHQHQQQFANSNAPMPHTHSPAQQAILPLQNGSQIQHQMSTQPAFFPTPNLQYPLPPPSSPMSHKPSQSQQKQQHGPKVLIRNPQAGSGLPNQMLKQQQRHQLQQQRQQSESQQANFTEGIGRENMLMHQNPVPLGKQLVPQTSSQCQQQQKLFSCPPHPLPNQPPQMPSNVDSNYQGQVQVCPNHTLLASQQAVPSSPLAMASQKPQRQTNRSQQTVERMLHQNHQRSSNSPVESSSDQIQDNPHSISDTSSTVPQCTHPSQWIAEPLYDTSTATPAAPSASMGNSPHSNLTGAEPMPLPSQSLAERQFSGSIPIHGHNVVRQWQQLPPSLQQH